MKRIAAIVAGLVVAACSDTGVGLDPASQPLLQIFSSSTAGDLEDPNDAYAEVAPDTYQRKVAGVFNGDRHYMRTVATNYNEGDFTAELVFTLSSLGSDGPTITYFGVGPGEGTSDYNEPLGILFRIHAPDTGSGVNVVDRDVLTGTTYSSFTFDPGTVQSGDTHRAIITKTGYTLLLSYDVSNDGIVDYTATMAPEQTNPQLDGTNSRVFFGTSTQDTFQLTIDTASDPTTVGDCTKGGWEAYGFGNQGQCIRFVNTGKDSRTE